MSRSEITPVRPIDVDLLCEAGYGNITRTSTQGPHMVFFTFPEDVRWNSEQSAVEFGVSIGEYEGVVRVPRRTFQRILDDSPTPERCIEAYYLNRTRLERIAERKLRQQQLTDDANVEITGRDLRERDDRRVDVV